MRVKITIETGPFTDLPDWQGELSEGQVHKLIRRIDSAIQDEELLHVAIQLRAHDLDSGKEIDI